MNFSEKLQILRKEKRLSLRIGNKEDNKDSDIKKR